MARKNGIQTFTYGPRQRFAFLPTFAFLVVVFAILALDPSLLWSTTVDESTRQAGLIISGVLAVGFAVALVARWLEPFRMELGADDLVATPLLGRAIRIPYAAILRVVERPRSFMRGNVELEIAVRDRRRPLRVRSSIQEYPRFVKLLRVRVPPTVRSEWKEGAGA